MREGGGIVYHGRLLSFEFWYLKHSLELHDQVPSFDWTQVSRVLVSLDWSFQKDNIPSFEDVLMTAHYSGKLRGKFAGLL